MLQVRPQETRAKLPGRRILELAKKEHASVLQYVRVMREFDFPAPDVTGIADTHQQIACALFTFQYTRAFPAEVTAGSHHGHLFAWRPHTHFACDWWTQRRVTTALMCFKSVCPRMPKDMRLMVLTAAFGHDDC